MKKSNYEVTRDQTRIRFLSYNQQHMIEKFHLDADASYLYLSFLRRPYRISRVTGKVEWSEDGFVTVREADYNESLTIYDLLCDSKEGCRLSGNFCSIRMLKGTVHVSGSNLDLYSEQAGKFQGRTDQLRAACAHFGEPNRLSGDVSYTLYPFSFLPITLQFWEGDEEFPPSLKFMVDENIQDFIRYETIYLMVGHVLARIREQMDKEPDDIKSN